MPDDFVGSFENSITWRFLKDHRIVHTWNFKCWVLMDYFYTYRSVWNYEVLFTNRRRSLSLIFSTVGVRLRTIGGDFHQFYHYFEAYARNCVIIFLSYEVKKWNLFWKLRFENEICIIMENIFDECNFLGKNYDQNCKKILIDIFDRFLVYKSMQKNVKMKNSYDPFCTLAEKIEKLNKCSKSEIFDWFFASKSRPLSKIKRDPPQLPPLDQIQELIFDTWKSAKTVYCHYCIKLEVITDFLISSIEFLRKLKLDQ